MGKYAVFGHYLTKKPDAVYYCKLLILIEFICIFSIFWTSWKVVNGKWRVQRCEKNLQIQSKLWFMSHQEIAADPKYAIRSFKTTFSTWNAVY